MLTAVPLVNVFRGEFLESIHTGHAVVARATGEIVESWGDPSLTVLPRSSAKMLQALPLAESEAGRDLSAQQLALACASHSGATEHVSRVAGWLEELGMSEGDLLCGPQASRDKGLRLDMIRKGQPLTRIHNNCSGKHAGFLCLAHHLGAGPDYVSPDHPVQIAVRAAFEDMCGEDSPGFGIDGCSAPNFATSLAGLARAMARFAAAGQGRDLRDAAAVRLREAMIAQPGLVAGHGRACTELMVAAKGRAAVKTGAEGVFVAILPDLGLGLALKIADGADRASEIAVAALLTRLGILEAEDPIVANYLDRPIRNWDGIVTGVSRPVPEILAR